MASNLQKHFQRKIADIDNEEDEELQTQCQNNPTFGFTEEKVDYHSEEEVEDPPLNYQYSAKNDAPIHETYPEKKSNEKVYNYKEKYPTKPQFKKKEIYSYKPQKEYVPKTTSSEENKEISDNPEKKSWRKEKKDHKKSYDYKKHNKEDYDYKKHTKEEYDVVYVEKTTERNDKKISFKSNKPKEFHPDTDKSKIKNMKLNKDAMAFKLNEAEAYEDEENTHVFIGFQKPLDLVTPSLTMPASQVYYPMNFTSNYPLQMQLPMNYGSQMYYPPPPQTNNFEYYN